MDHCINVHEPDNGELDIKLDKIRELDNGKPDKIHNGKPITMLEVSPNVKYLVTYSEVDKSIVGWDVDEFEEQPKQLKPDNNTIEINFNYTLNRICVSD